MKTINASHIMTKKVIVANLKSKYSEVIDFFVNHKIQHLPVVSENVLVGILSTNDMLRFIAEITNSGIVINDSVLENKFKVEKVMTRSPVSVVPKTTVEDVVKILAKGNFQAVPVIEGENVLGIISNKDIVSFYDWKNNKS